MVIIEGVRGVQWKTDDWSTQDVSSPVGTKQSFQSTRCIYAKAR